MGSRLMVFVPGRPIPQGSKRPMMVRGKNPHPVMIEGNKNLLDPWRSKVTYEVARAALEQPFASIPRGIPVGVRLVFVFDRPQSHYGTGRNADKVKEIAPKYPSGAPDTDKLTRAIFDSITDSQVWGDDGQVVWLEARKVWAGTETHSGQGVHIQLGVMR